MNTHTKTMTSSNLIQLNKDIAVSPRLHKSLLRFCRIVDVSLEEFLWINYEAEARYCKDEIQATIRAKKAGLTREEYQAQQLERAKSILFSEAS